MLVTVEAMARLCRLLLVAEPSAPRWSLESCLNSIPRLDSLADLPSGTHVLVRGDLLEGSPERIFQTHAGLMAGKNDGPLQNQRLHHTPRMLLQTRDTGTAKAR